MAPRLTLDPNHYHAGGIDADDRETEIQIVGRGAHGGVTDLLVLTPAQAQALREWLEGLPAVELPQ